MTEHGYEQSDAKLKPLVVFAVALAVLCIVSFAISASLQGRWEEELETRSERHPMSDLRGGPQGPLLQTTTREELAELRAREDERLHGTGWIDPEAGVVHIPVEQAMELILERGLPARAEEGAR